MSISTESRRIYVACLASYNSGTLHGEWLDVDGATAYSLQEQVNAMLRASPFPNVTVTCPQCEGQPTLTYSKGIGSGAVHVCTACNGTGEVPSAEEFAIHDSEGFAGLLGEYTSLEDVVKIAEMLDEHGEAWAAYVEHFGTDGTEDDFQERYNGKYDSARDWAEQFADDTGLLESVPDNLRYYFDFDAYARDARMNGDLAFCDHEGDVYVFWNH